MFEKAAAVKRFEYSTLSSHLKKPTSTGKDQYDFFKDQMNANYNKYIKDYLKTEEDEIGNVEHSCNSDKYKDLIENISNYRLRDRGLHLKEFDNRKLTLGNIVSNSLKIRF